MSLSVLILILLAQFLLKHMDKFLGKGLNISILFEMVYYNMAWVMALAVPMAILVSTLMAFGRLSNDNEILAMRSSGITYKSMLSPALIFAIAISLIMIYFNNWILPDMNYKARNLISNISKKNPDILFQEGQLHNELDGYIIYFESKDPKSGKFKNTTIIEHNNKITKTITSKYAELIEDYNDDLISLYLEDGFIYEKSKKENEYRTIEFENNIIRIDANNFSFQRRTTKYRGDRELVFDSIKVKIDSFDKKIAKSKKRIKDRILIINPNYTTESPDSALTFIKDELNKLSAISATKENINAIKRSLKNIERGIKHDKAQIESNSRLKNKYIVELHKKFSIPIASIVFVFAGAPLGIIARRGKFSISMAISLIFFLIYWAFLIAGEEFADQGRINPILSMWLPNIILFIIGLFLNLKTINEMKRIKIFNMKRNKDV
tara:strand:+ start:203 stop:1513 length:1311 start_codon:yes stop_codon:yes gene_type:complete